MKPFRASCWLLALALVATQFAQTVHADDEDETEEDNLLTKIKCKVGDKYEYMMATQSSLLDQHDANLLVKTKLELKCLDKKSWLNGTNGELKNGQLFEGRIIALTPVHLNASNSPETVTIKNGKLQMAALFSSLDSLSENPDAKPGEKQPNLKVGAVNNFFAEFAQSFGELVSQLFQKLVKFFENLLKRRKNGADIGVGSRTSGISWKCNADKSKGRRLKRQSFKSINFAQFGTQINDMFKHPFTFIQLEDGSVQSVQLSPSETNPSVKHFKRFLAQSFATQLDQRKKTVMEQSSLGDHMSHYQMEYDEPDKGKVTPEQYMSSATKRAKRSNSAGTPRTHLVSVVRSIKREDMLANKDTQERNQYRHKTLQLADIDFNAQQVQLVENNLIVASGGYFHSILPVTLKEAAKQRKARSVPANGDNFDEVLTKYLTMNLEYSMVRITKNRWRRSIDEGSRVAESPRHVSAHAVAAYISAMRNLAVSTANFTSQALENLTRRKRNVGTAEAGASGSDNNVVCRAVPAKRWPNSQIEREDANVIKDSVDSNELKECYEYKEFGSGWLKAFFNRSIVTGQRKGKSLDNFETKYRLGAQMLGETLFMGQIEVSKNEDASKLRINLFGSEYIDLNLCDIRDKVFSQANQIPMFSENIWFMTNVAIKINYDLNFKVSVPGAVCDTDAQPEKGSALNNSIILSRMMQDQFNLNQNTKIDLGGSFDASFLIFNGEMKLGGNFDMDSNIDFGQSCLSARSTVRPMNVSLNFNYKFFHPLCGEWQEDNWIPRQLSWSLNKPYRNSWFDNVCV